MKKIGKLIIILLTLISFNCGNNDKEDLIEGVRITGDKDVDLLVLLAATSGSSCNAVISESNKTFVYADPSFTVCSNITTEATITVPTSGNYSITARRGIQTLSSFDCNSRTFNFNVILKDGSTNLISSEGSTKTLTLALQSGKTYTISNDGLASPSGFTCRGITPTSSVSNFELKFEKQ